MTDNRDVPVNPAAHLLEESLEELYEHAPCGYISTLPDGTFAKVNQTFLAWTGYEREELLSGRRFQDLLTIGGRIFHETHYAPLLRMQGNVKEIAFDLICRDGRQLPILVNAIQKRDVNGAPLLNRTTIFNASDRRTYEQELLRARQQAEQANQAKARSLSTISHEIRNKLASIMLATQRLEQSGADPKQQKYIQILNSSSQSLLALVNDILDYSKIEAGNVRLEQQRFSLPDLLHDMLARFEDRAEEKQLRLHASIDERLPASLIGDPLKIDVVLTNLISNALKFTHQGSVTLRVQVSDMLDDAVAIDFSIKDTGIGIASAQLSSIFEEFAQASGNTSLKYGGTGLGLAISRKLVQLHGSDIHVTSMPEEGSTFFFTLRLTRTLDVVQPSLP